MKKLFYTLLLLALAATQNIFAQEATALKNSFIVPNGAWYAGSGTGVTVFNGLDLGKLTALTLNGQIESVGESDPKNLPVIMHYKIDDYYEHTIELNWYGADKGVNRFGTPDGQGSVDVDLSYVKGGEHTLAVWFSKESSSETATGGFVYDSNNGANYVAKFSTDTKYSIKNNWDADTDNWTWKQMTKEGDVFVLNEVVFGGKGVNVSETADEFDNIWISEEDFLGDDIQAGDVVKLEFNPINETITATFIKSPTNADDNKFSRKPKCIRIWENGQWLIICGNEVYNLLGSHVRTISK